MVATADYQNLITKNRVQRKIPFISVSGEREVCFGNYQKLKLLGTGDRIGNLLEHFQSPKYSLY
jgi:hypothetical protein